MTTKKERLPAVIRGIMTVEGGGVIRSFLGEENQYGVHGPAYGKEEGDACQQRGKKKGPLKSRTQFPPLSPQISLCFY